MNTRRQALQRALDHLTCCLPTSSTRNLERFLSNMSDYMYKPDNVITSLDLVQDLVVVLRDYDKD